MYSRSAKGGEKGDPNRNPWLAKMGSKWLTGFREKYFSKKVYDDGPNGKTVHQICWKLIIFGCLKVTFILSDIIWLGNNTSYHIRSYGNILESNITLKLSLLLTVL
jgi:hypothetical protein